MWSARFLAQSLRRGFQDVAPRIADMATAAAALDRHGPARMPVPGNYRDDVRMRFGLGDEVAALRAHDILIDRDCADHRYRQLYSRAFAKKFFLEFVTREAGYDGYGAPNAAIRLAA